MCDDVQVCWVFSNTINSPSLNEQMLNTLITNVLTEKQSKPVAFSKHQVSSTQTSQLGGTFLTETQTTKATSADGCTLHGQQRTSRL